MHQHVWILAYKWLWNLIVRQVKFNRFVLNIRVSPGSMKKLGQSPMLSQYVRPVLDVSLTPLLQLKNQNAMWDTSRHKSLVCIFRTGSWPYTTPLINIEAVFGRSITHLVLFILTLNSELPAPHHISKLPPIGKTSF